MKTTIAYIVVLLVASQCALAAQLGSDDLERIRPHISKLDIKQFTEYMTSDHFEIGVVPSSWHPVNLIGISYSQEKHIKAARDFGGALFLRIEDWAAEMKAAKPAAESVKEFLNLADWLMKSPGYGNFFMAKRCHEIAVFGIARTLADTNCPLDGVTNQLPRFNASWKTPSGRAKMLNDDVGSRLFEVPSGDEKAQQQYLERVWNIGKIMVMKYSTPEMQAAFEGHPPKGMEDVSEMVRRWYLGAYETPFMREHVSFFKDDGKVSAENWNANDHEALIIPYQEPQLPRLKCLAEFRAAIGYFPGEYVPNEDSATSKQKEAFVQAWTVFRKQKGLPDDIGVAETAWEVFRDVMASTFPG